MPTDLDLEQRYLDRAHQHLGRIRAQVSGLIDGLEVDARNDVDAATARHQLQGYRQALDVGTGPLCFGRIDEETGERWYVGRRHVEDERGDAVVVDWRAGVAVPFYRATFRDPLGLHLRRRFVVEGRQLVGCFDEDFDDPDSAHHATGVADPLLAELDRARTGEIRDIVATIQAEQDVVIRAPLDQLLIVQGGPGTGKTAVGLHRAALLLYDHREALERDGVLIVGPNRTFLRYIAQVLPSLGETSVIQTTVAGLGRVDVQGVDGDESARLKGDLRMVELVRRAAWDRIEPLTEPVEARTRFGTIRLDPAEVDEVLEAALADRRTVASSREHFRVAVTGRAYQRLLDRRPEGLQIEDEVRQAVQTSTELRRIIDRVWPATTAPKLVHRLLTNRAFLARHGDGLLDAGEQRLLLRKAARRLDDQPWTEADVALVDEGDAVLGIRPRRYGHLVVDEAQDLSPMAWRLLARRCSRFPSMTVLGDLAQATAPAAQQRWEDVIADLGSPEARHLAELEVGYRVPGQILDLANRLLPATGAAVTASRSVRSTPHPARFVPAEDGAVALAAAPLVGELLARHASVGVISAFDRLPLDALSALDAEAIDRLGVLTAAEAKGLEFDAVVVLEPAAFLAAGRRGARLLYIALTRAVQELVVVHAEPLPDELAAPTGRLSSGPGAPAG